MLHGSGSTRAVDRTDRRKARKMPVAMAARLGTINSLPSRRGSDLIHGQDLHPAATALLAIALASGR